MSFPLKKLLRSPQGLVAVAALAVLLASMIALGRLEAGGVTHADLELDDGTPATLYLPGRAVEHWLLPNPPPPERRPPGVVISHAFGADRASMSTLARRLARNGYAALAIDLGGHGTNRQRFPPGRGRVDLLGPTLDASFDFLSRPVAPTRSGWRWSDTPSAPSGRWTTPTAPRTWRRRC